MNAVLAISETLAPYSVPASCTGSPLVQGSLMSAWRPGCCLCPHTGCGKAAWREYQIYFDCSDFTVMAVLGSLIWRNIGKKYIRRLLVWSLLYFPSFIFLPFSDEGLVLGPGQAETRQAHITDKTGFCFIIIIVLNIYIYILHIYTYIYIIIFTFLELNDESQSDYKIIRLNVMNKRRYLSLVICLLLSLAQFAQLVYFY